MVAGVDVAAFSAAASDDSVAAGFDYLEGDCPNFVAVAHCSFWTKGNALLLGRRANQGRGEVRKGGKGKKANGQRYHQGIQTGEMRNGGNYGCITWW